MNRRKFCKLISGGIAGVTGVLIGKDVIKPTRKEERPPLSVSPLQSQRGRMWCPLEDKDTPAYICDGKKWHTVESLLPPGGK